MCIQVLAYPPEVTSDGDCSSPTSKKSDKGGGGKPDKNSKTDKKKDDKPAKVMHACYLYNGHTGRGFGLGVQVEWKCWNTEFHTWSIVTSVFIFVFNFFHLCMLHALQQSAQVVFWSESLICTCGYILNNENSDKFIYWLSWLFCKLSSIMWVYIMALILNRM